MIDWKKKQLDFNTVVKSLGDRAYANHKGKNPKVFSIYCSRNRFPSYKIP